MRCDIVVICHLPHYSNIALSSSALEYELNEHLQKREIQASIFCDIFAPCRSKYKHITSASTCYGALFSFIYRRRERAVCPIFPKSTVLCSRFINSPSNLVFHKESTAPLALVDMLEFWSYMMSKKAVRYTATKKSIESTQRII